MFYFIDPKWTFGRAILKIKKDLNQLFEGGPEEALKLIETMLGRVLPKLKEDE